MSLFEKIQELCKTRNITIGGLEKALGFSNGSIRKLRDKYSTMSAERLNKVADYFGVSLSYFKEEETELPTPDAKNILEQVIASLGADAQVNFSASEMSEDEKAFLLKSLQNSLEKFELYKSLKEEWQDDNQ
jgi:transcriptional regulator with XRE-family HTH domain